MGHLHTIQQRGALARGLLSEPGGHEGVHVEVSGEQERCSLIRGVVRALLVGSAEVLLVQKVVCLFDGIDEDISDPETVIPVRIHIGRVFDRRVEHCLLVAAGERAPVLPEPRRPGISARRWRVVNRERCCLARTQGEGHAADTVIDHRIC